MRPRVHDRGDPRVVVGEEIDVLVEVHVEALRQSLEVAHDDVAHRVIQDVEQLGGRRPALGAAQIAVHRVDVSRPRVRVLGQVLRRGGAEQEHQVAGRVRGGCGAVAPSPRGARAQRRHRFGERHVDRLTVLAPGMARLGIDDDHHEERRFGGQIVARRSPR